MVYQQLNKSIFQKNKENFLSKIFGYGNNYILNINTLGGGLKDINYNVIYKFKHYFSSANSDENGMIKKYNSII